jgi:hypothetical protein
MDKMVDLGSKPEKHEPIKASKSPSVYYPTLHISGSGEVDLTEGASVTIKGTVKRSTKTTANGKTTYSYEIECQKMSCESCESEDEGDGLEKAMDKIAKKKTAPKKYEGDGDDE